MRPPTELAASFRATGRKVTPQRERIFRVLHENPTHPSAEAVHAAVVADMPSVSLRTVYSTLHELADMGELRQLHLGTGSARFDPNTADHHHLVCVECGSVRDLHSAFPGVDLPVGDGEGFEVESTQIVFRGRCAHCAAAATPSPTPGTPVHPVPDHEEYDIHG